VVGESIMFPKKESARFCLVGSGKVLTSFAKMLLENDFDPPVLVTWKKSLHERDFHLLKGNSNYENIFEFAADNNLCLIQTKNINDQSLIEELKSKNVNIIFSISSRWIFRQPIIDAFNGLAINIHGGYLPRDRGSVVYSKILNGATELGVTIHLMSLSVDAGHVLFRVKKNIDISSFSIDKITAVIQKLSTDLLNKFLHKLSQGNALDCSPQNNNDGIYMPQPYTELNGFIDWKWKLRHIESFIRAFGRPMPGAATFYKDKKIKVLEAFCENIDFEFHPLYLGRIVNITHAGFAKIVTEDGLLVITKIEYDGREMLPKELLKAPNILYTPSDVLEKARLENISSLQMSPIPNT
jgi:methionyl-tRNA formyltransferase